MATVTVDAPTPLQLALRSSVESMLSLARAANAPVDDLFNTGAAPPAEEKPSFPGAEYRLNGEPVVPSTSYTDLANQAKKGVPRTFGDLVSHAQAGKEGAYEALNALSKNGNSNPVQGNAVKEATKIREAKEAISAKLQIAVAGVNTADGSAPPAETPWVAAINELKSMASSHSMPVVRTEARKALTTLSQLPEADKTMIRDAAAAAVAALPAVQGGGRRGVTRRRRGRRVGKTRRQK